MGKEIRDGMDTKVVSEIEEMYKYSDKHMSCADEPIHFALLVPFSGSWKAHRTAGAAELAVERVNADKALLPGRRYHCELLYIFHPFLHEFLQPIFHQ